MNENSSTHSSLSAPHHGLTAEMISRRAYELWEQEGRPEARDLHHWLRAEQELLAERGNSSSSSASPQNTGKATSAPSPVSRPATDTPLQTARPATTAPAAKAPTKRPPTSTPTPARSTQPGMRTGTNGR